MTSYIDTAFPGTMDERDHRVLIRFVKDQLFGMCIDWVSSGMKDDAMDDLQRVIDLCRGIPELILARSRGEQPG